MVMKTSTPKFWCSCEKLKTITGIKGHMFLETEARDHNCIHCGYTAVESEIEPKSIIVKNTPTSSEFDDTWFPGQDAILDNHPNARRVNKTRIPYAN